MKYWTAMPSNVKYALRTCEIFAYGKCDDYSDEISDAFAGHGDGSAGPMGTWAGGTVPVALQPGA